MLLNKGFNDKSTQTKSTTFHSREEGMSPAQELQIYENQHTKKKGKSPSSSFLIQTLKS